MSVLTSTLSRVFRRRPVLFLLGFGVAWKVVVFTLGAAVPRWMVGDGIAHLPPAEQPYATTAQMVAGPLWNLPIERLGLVRALRVVRVDTAHGLSPADSATGAACGNLQATVRAYTFFGIPYGEARTLCTRGEVRYRVFPKRR